MMRHHGFGGHARELPRADIFEPPPRQRASDGVGSITFGPAFESER